jgi:hypothetical protein
MSHELQGTDKFQVVIDSVSRICCKSDRGNRTEMKASLKIVLRYYKYASIIFLIGFPIYLVVDDWVLTKHISSFSDLALFAGGHLLFTVVYYLFFSIYFWLLALVIIFLYQKIYKTRVAKN